MKALDFGTGARLIERAIPGTSLAATVKSDDRLATRIIADVIADLLATRAPLPQELPANRVMVGGT